MCDGQTTCVYYVCFFAICLCFDSVAADLDNEIEDRQEPLCQRLQRPGEKQVLGIGTS